MNILVYEKFSVLLSEKNDNEVINNLYGFSDDEALKILTFFSDEKIEKLYKYCMQIHCNNSNSILSKEEYINQIIKLNKSRQYYMDIKYETDDIIEFINEGDVNDYNLEITIKDLTTNQYKVKITLNGSYWITIDEKDENNYHAYDYSIHFETDDFEFKLTKIDCNEEEFIKICTFIQNIHCIFYDKSFAPLNSFKNMLFIEIHTFITDEKNKAINGVNDSVEEND